MKILITNASYPPNLSAGAERVVQTLAGALVQSGHQVVIATTQPHGERATGQVEGVRVHYLPVRNVYRPFADAKPGNVRKALWHLWDSYNPAMARAVGEILDLERPDVVNTHNLVGLSAAVWGAAKSRHLPLVHTLHDQYLLCTRSTMFRGDRSCTRACLECRVCAVPRRLASQQVDLVVGVSRYILERHVGSGYFAEASQRVVYNCVAQDPRPAARESRGAAPLRFGFLGQIRSTKGLHRLIDAFAAECPAEAELWIAGRGDEDYEAGLRKRTAGSPSIRWLGFVNQSELLGAIDVLVVPSLWHDTAPLVLLEAFSHGVPVLGARRGGIPEFITPETGWVFEPEDPGAFRAALRRCLQQQDQLARMGRSAIHHARDYDRARFVAGYLEAYEDAGVQAGKQLTV